MLHVCERREMLTGFWWETPKEKNTFGRPHRGWADDIKMPLNDTWWEGVY
jgi:hypothetical protein